MRITCILSFLILLYTTCYGQVVPDTYYDKIEGIIATNCMPCHRPGGSAPFSLTTYDDIAKRADFIGYVTKSGYMPPWRADRSFQEYKNERGLTADEINSIQNWIKNKMPKGSKPRKKNDPIALVENEKPDLILKMKDSYSIPTDGVDDYRFFNVPTNLNEEKYLRKIEFVPENKKLVHHSRLMTDTSHMVRDINGMSANDPGINKFEKYPPIDKFLYGWVPGNSAIEFPKGTGKRLFKETDLILNIHYAPNSKKNQSDQSQVNLYFTDKKTEREVYSLAIAEDNISNPPFLIKANEVKTFYSSFGPIPIDISAIGVLPHMHYIGKSFRAFAVTPDGDAINLIKIDDWDFRWQETYLFKTFQFIPKNSVILFEATFDNTIDNPENPNSPPKDITYGWNTTSEMMDLVVYYLVYQEGDKNRVNE